MIQEDYVSFGVAKLLKEKGFEGKCHNSMQETTTHYSDEWNSSFTETTDIPTLQMAMKWLRESNNIHIEVRYFPMPNIYRYVIIHSPATFENIDSHPQYFNTYEQACEAGIKYCLEKLI